jgi:hypothetical protein
MLNFQDLQVVEKANTRKSSPRGQNWRGRFRQFERTVGGEAKLDHLFYISNAVWDELNLEELGLIQAKDGDKVYLLTVDNEKAVILKKTSKGDKNKKFKAEILFNDLVSAGVLSGDVIGDSQFFDVQSVEMPGIPDYVHGVYEVIAVDAPEEEDGDDTDTDGGDEDDME